MSTAKDKRRLGPLEARQPLAVAVDGEPVAAFAGESVATVLLALGQRPSATPIGTTRPAVSTAAWASVLTAWSPSTASITCGPA